eukprot:superscaffoldBa00004762_g19409
MKFQFIKTLLRFLKPFMDIATSTINCNGGGNLHVGAVDEGYSGDVELVNGITEGVKLVPHIKPAHLEFLELSFTPGETSATVRTKKPLDADADILVLEFGQPDSVLLTELEGKKHK